MAEKLYTKICPGCFTEGPSTSKCPHCGYDASSTPYPQALEPGTVLNTHYLVGKVLGKPGGFGITYLAWDNTLETRVAIKEFLPAELASRDYDRQTVIPHSNEEQTIFESGLQSFLKEARTLAKFHHHPNIVRVRHFFQENGTAYMVMDYYQGKTLWEQQEQRNKSFTEAEALQLMLPILEGLQEVHTQGFVHRDIKPQNIYITQNNQPILLDFGAARGVVGEKSRSLSVVLTPGFAPFEQYQSKGKQGPWTDIYGVSATLYFMLTGKIPPDALERKADDSALALTGLSPTLRTALGKGLSVDREQRPQTIQEFRAMLTNDNPDPYDNPTGNRYYQTQNPTPQENQTGLTAAIFAGIFIVLFLIIKTLLMTVGDGPDEADVIPLALGFSAASTLVYWLSVYIMYRIGQKFRVGSMPGFSIPFYNSVLLCRCADISGWAVILMFVPYIGVVFPIWLYGAIAQRLGKNFWLYGLGSLIVIPVLILAFDDSKPDPSIITVEPDILDNSKIRQPLPPPEPVPVVLHFLSGDFEGERITVPPEGIILGRNPAAANIVFPDGSVSGRHLRVTLSGHDGGKAIEDLNSTNGTFFSYSPPPVQWRRLTGRLEETEGQPVWIRIADDGPIIKIS